MNDWFFNKSSVTNPKIGMYRQKAVHSYFPCNVREKIRTPDTLVRSQVLYPAELRTHIADIDDDNTSAIIVRIHKTARLTNKKNHST